MNNDLISRSALLEDLKEQHDYIMQDPEVGKTMKWCEAVCFNRTVETMESAPAVDAGPKWISVEDRLPETESRCLVVRYDYVTKTSFMDVLWFDKGTWWNRIFDGEYAVTHWMPLPEPPEEG